jgi:hypothetical protein
MDGHLVRKGEQNPAYRPAHRHLISITRGYGGNMASDLVIYGIRS